MATNPKTFAQNSTILAAARCDQAGVPLNRRQRQIVQGAIRNNFEAHAVLYALENDNPFKDFTYQDYLHAFEQNGGDGDPITPAEFEGHRAELEAAHVQFQQALADDNDEGMRDALARSFPHEEALLI